MPIESFIAESGFAPKVVNAAFYKATRSVDLSLARPFKAGIRSAKDSRVALATRRKAKSLRFLSIVATRRSLS